jgi:hypothetical protein
MTELLPVPALEVLWHRGSAEWRMHAAKNSGLASGEHT